MPRVECEVAYARVGTDKEGEPLEAVRPRLAAKGEHGREKVADADIGDAAAAVESDQDPGEALLPPVAPLHGAEAVGRRPVDAVAGGANVAPVPGRVADGAGARVVLLGGERERGVSGGNPAVD